ncbi:YhcH/YjgK/YiaL family protein [Vibrio sp. A2-1]|uniref:YhcH/YjgK/YiaL family protein n=1 Tax=Vibrio sp. A2-1 TaxID=2912252 RepID=UPI001F474DB7|nr:YhcH/YjgK/YiaL family protein [Vibrio sp. A2-1]MCF7485354.1 YhcH/YjgK/YiaL family protein [Vibrio sp. A2-1]
MLVGNTQPTQISKSYPVVIQNVLEYLNSLDQEKLALGRHELPGFDSKQAWFVVLEYDKEPLGNFQPEVHKYHSDLQIILEGSEVMAWAIDTGEHSNAHPYNQERDLQFYEYPGIELSFIHAKRDQFYLFTPNIVHITNIENDDSQPVRKLVVKIHNDLLEAK